MDNILPQQEMDMGDFSVTTAAQNLAGEESETPLLGGSHALDVDVYIGQVQKL